MSRPMVDNGRDIEDLKVNKIESPARGGAPRLLPTVAEPVELPTEEAYGGSGVAPTAPVDKEALHGHIVDALKTVYDPEIPVNIYDLGLIYGVDIDDRARVEISMTLTAPGCPVAGMLVQQVAASVGDVPGVNQSHVTLTWDPPWTKDRMSEAAMLELGLL